LDVVVYNAQQKIPNGDERYEKEARPKTKAGEDRRKSKKGGKGKRKEKGETDLDKLHAESGPTRFAQKHKNKRQSAWQEQFGV